jgi:hypothetical protein
MSLLEKCHDFQLLTPIEQIRTLWTLSATRTFLNILHENYNSLSDAKEYEKLWSFVKEISTAPGATSRSSRRRLQLTPKKKQDLKQAQYKGSL